MPIIWFIRHGESTSNADLPTTHPAESTLTPKGTAEAQSIVSSFDEKPSLIVVSSYLRARQTAEPTLAHFEPVAQEEWPVHEFTYLDPIRYLNTTGTERMPFALEYWARNDPDYKDGGVGESFAELMQRVKTMIARLQRHPADFIVVFSHGLFLRALIWSLLADVNEGTPETMKRYCHFIRSVWMPNGAILKARFMGDEEITFSTFDTTHLPHGETA